MSVFAFASPLQTALPAVRSFAGSMAGATRPLFGLGVLVTFLMMFKPLVSGLLRAAMMIVAPRKSGARLARQAQLRDTAMLHRMARELDQSQPSLAAELRGFASR